MQNIRPVLLADSAVCLTKVCGITVLERLLRSLQRLGFSHATVVTANEPVALAAKTRSWASADVIVDLASAMPEPCDPILMIPADIYCDLRLLRALCQKRRSAHIADGPRLIVPGSDGSETIDPGEIDDYIASMRRRIPPVCRRVTPANAGEIDRLILDSAQKGSLDIPAHVHAPFERFLATLLCRTAITPNQITLITALVSMTVTLQFAAGWLVFGTIVAVIVGILDGVDGKLARVKMETTELGEWEHKVDAVLEASWWLALGFHFHVTGEVENAIMLPVWLLAAHAVADLARRYVEALKGRSMDDLTPADRAFRLIGGRRNVYVWIFAIALLLGKPAAGFEAFCIWGMFTCAVHVARAIMIWAQPRELQCSAGPPVTP